MAPDVSFHLTDDLFERFHEILQAHAITVRDTYREIHENLEHGGVERETFGGFLKFNGTEFNYYRARNPPLDGDLARCIPSDHPNVRVLCTFYSVTIVNHTVEVLEPLFDVLDQAFPQPARKVLGVLPPPHPWNIARWRYRTGCLFGLLLVGGICFFTLYGLRAFFHAL